MTSDTSQEIKFSHRQPPWHVVVLGVFTLLAYLPFWVNKTANALKQEGLFKKSILTKIPSWLLGLSMLVPILNILTIASIFNTAINIHPQADFALKKNPGLAAFLLGVLMCLLFPMSKGDGPTVLLFTLGVAPVAWCQQWLNDYWTVHEDEGLIYREAFSVPELLVIIIGSLIFGLIVFSFMIEKTS